MSQNIIAREYNATTGAFIGNLTSLSFGNTPVGTHSPVKVIDLAFTGVSMVSNVKIAILSTGLTIADVPSNTINSDGTTASGYFGIAHSSNFISNNVISTHFRKVYNSKSIPTNEVSIGTRDSASVISQYIYLDIQLSNANLGAQGGSYRIFFDYV